MKTLFELPKPIEKDIHRLISKYSYKGKEYQKEYEDYMKSVVDLFAKTVNYEGGESIIAGREARIGVITYANPEYLLFHDTELKNLYTGNYPIEDVVEWRENKQELGNNILNEKTLTYNEWVVRHKDCPNQIHNI